MKPYEALELQAKAMRLVEGTELEWFNVLRSTTSKLTVQPYELLQAYDIDRAELALAIVEGKPVFDGDTLYTNTGNKFVVSKLAQHYQAFANNYSWNPPKPKTVMVELLVDDAEYYAGCTSYERYTNLGNACRKALGELK